MISRDNKCEKVKNFADHVRVQIPVGCNVLQ